jgi:hypothetical protein
MSRNSQPNPGLNPSANAVGLERSLSLILPPFLFGLMALRQAERQWERLGQLSESLLQGEQLPILDRRCSDTQNSVDL